MIAGIPCRLGKFLDYDLLGRVTRVTHTEIDHVFSETSFLLSKFVDLGKKVRGETPQSLCDLD
jgi:hypothetical protein